MKVLFIDSCMKNGEESRTKILCNRFMDALKKKHPKWEYETVVLKDMNLQPYYMDRVQRRYDLINAGNYDDTMFDLARQFAEADRIVIGAPYWDLAFPSVLKMYIEHVFVGGLTYKGTEHGLEGLAKGEKALFIQTAGGFIGEKDPGKEYLKYVLETLGIDDFDSVLVGFLDVVGANVDEILEEATLELQKIASEWQGSAYYPELSVH